MLIICLKYRKNLVHTAAGTNLSRNFAGQRKHHRKEATETLKKAEVQRDRYYATIHKVALHGDKIPGLRLVNSKFCSHSNCCWNFLRIIRRHQPVRNVPAVRSKHFGSTASLRTGEYFATFFHVSRKSYDWRMCITSAASSSQTTSQSISLLQHCKIKCLIFILCCTIFDFPGWQRNIFTNYFSSELFFDSFKNLFKVLELVWKKLVLILNSKWHILAPANVQIASKLWWEPSSC